MKKLYLFLLLGLLSPSYLRAQDTGSLRYKLDYLLAPLDKSQVQVGFLNQYGGSSCKRILLANWF